jgi:serine/threonine-protein kinase
MVEVSQRTRGELAPGTLIASRYRVTGLLGRGGMGAVYEAEHVELGRQVALKTVLPQDGQSEHVSARLIREARAAARIGHPGIVDVFDLLEHDGVTFVVMERLHGEELHQRIQREGRLSVGFALRMGVEVGGAIAAAHAHGIIHRDLKPRNVFIARDARLGEVFKVLDFGIAKLTHDIDLRLATFSGHVVGTPAYMAPERLAGVSHVDGRADVYAIGAMLYEALTGRPPFEAKSYPELVLRVSSEQPRSIAERRGDVPDAFCEVIARALSKDPNARQSSAAELVSELTAIDVPADMLDSGCRPTSPHAVLSLGAASELATATVVQAGAQRARRWPRRLALTTLALCALAVGARWLHGRADPPHTKPAPLASRHAGNTPGAAPGSQQPAPTAVTLPAGVVTAPPAGAATPAPALREVRFETVPAGAAVALDGTEVCLTPCVRTLPEGAEVALALTLKGHAPERRTLRPPLPARVSAVLVARRTRVPAADQATRELPGLPPLLPR